MEHVYNDGGRKAAGYKGGKRRRMAHKQADIFREI
jgi:hypothetical protein